MLADHEFLPALRAAVPRFDAHPPDVPQHTCISHDPATPLMIVAGPGSGKTTVLVLRALQFVFVRGWLPEHIVITTFTRKAAEELRSRLIGWGVQLKTHLAQQEHYQPPPGWSEWLAGIDINRFVTGTLDSLCEDVLTTHRDPRDAAPVLVENFVGNGILVREALFPHKVHSDGAIDAYLGGFTLDGAAPTNFGEKVGICRTLIDRFAHDLVDLDQYRVAPSHTNARQSLATCATSYQQSMLAAHRLDFALLESAFLERLRSGRLARFTSGIKALLVDEYQDTNPLQEQIYFTIVQHASPSFTVVGDDDQSLYRFRGATVELFRDFDARFKSHLPTLPVPQMIHLVNNYRSTPPIVEFYNTFIHCDPAFQPARVQPPKPQIRSLQQSNGVPVLGMFRPTASQLADDLTAFLRDVFRGPGRAIVTPSGQHTIVRAPNGGDIGDAVLLSHTVNELAPAFGQAPQRQRLPHLLRTRLGNLQPRIDVFNPRGRMLRDVPAVQRLLGLVLNCIDGDSRVQGGLPLRRDPLRVFGQWRQEATQFASTDPHPTTPHTLRAFVESWRTRAPQTHAAWPSEWPLLELCFKLVAWLPELRDDPEGQVYLEAVSRAIAQAATFSPYRSRIIRGEGPHEDNSVKAAIRDVLVPIAEAYIDVDEEVMPHVPRDRFPIMTIHQAKGLEFPLVIVDVASDYSRNHPTNRFRRFPERPSSVQHMEDDLAPFSAIGTLRQVRAGLQRSFDDLVRLYYVAYSRPECVLLLVGLDACLRYQTKIRHVALGWRSDATWSWQAPVNGRAPALINNHPLHLL